MLFGVWNLQVVYWTPRHYPSSQRGNAWQIVKTELGFGAVSPQPTVARTRSTLCRERWPIRPKPAAISSSVQINGATAPAPSSSSRRFLSRAAAFRISTAAAAANALASLFQRLRRSIISTVFWTFVHSSIAIPRSNMTVEIVSMQSNLPGIVSWIFWTWHRKTKTMRTQPALPPSSSRLQLKTPPELMTSTGVCLL